MEKEKGTRQGARTGPVDDPVITPRKKKKVGHGGICRHRDESAKSLDCDRVQGKLETSEDKEERPKP